MRLRAGAEGAYADWKANNTDAYGAAIFRYAERWADLLEKAHEDQNRLRAGTEVPPAEFVDTVQHHADRTSREANSEGITGYMYGVAVAILTKTWEHGEALRRWHNLATQIHDEGAKANESGGILNPALLRIDVPGES